MVVLKLAVLVHKRSWQKGGAVKKYNYPLDTDGVNYPHTINIQIFSSGGGGAKDGADSGFTEGSTESSDGNDNAGATAEGGGGQGFIDAETITEQAKSQIGFNGDRPH